MEHIWRILSLSTVELLWGNLLRDSLRLALMKVTNAILLSSDSGLLRASSRWRYRSHNDFLMVALCSRYLHKGFSLHLLGKVSWKALYKYNVLLISSLILESCPHKKVWHKNVRKKKLSLKFFLIFFICFLVFIKHKLENLENMIKIYSTLKDTWQKKYPVMLTFSL